MKVQLTTGLLLAVMVVGLPCCHGDSSEEGRPYMVQNNIARLRNRVNNRRGNYRKTRDSDSEEVVSQKQAVGGAAIGGRENPNPIVVQGGVPFGGSGRSNGNGGSTGGTNGGKNGGTDGGGNKGSGRGGSPSPSPPGSSEEISEEQNEDVNPGSQMGHNNRATDSLNNVIIEMGSYSSIVDADVNTPSYRRQPVATDSSEEVDEEEEEEGESEEAESESQQPEPMPASESESSETEEGSPSEETETGDYDSGSYSISLISSLVSSSYDFTTEDRTTRQGTVATTNGFTATGATTGMDTGSGSTAGITFGETMFPNETDAGASGRGDTPNRLALPPADAQKLDSPTKTRLAVSAGAVGVAVAFGAGVFVAKKVVASSSASAVSAV